MGTTLIILLILLLSIHGIKASGCSEAADGKDIPNIRMCEDGNVTSDRVILDTHKAADTGETTCSCTVNATYFIIFYIEHYGEGLNPNTSSCGSEVVVTSGSLKSEDRHYRCNTSPFPIIYIKPSTITWNRTSSGDSKYCLNVTGVVEIPNTTFTIRCVKPVKTSTPASTSVSTKTETTTRTESTTNTVTTTGQGSLNTSQMTVSDLGTTTTDQSTVPTTSSEPGNAPPQTKDSLPLIIVIPAAAGGLILIIIIIIIVVCCRKSGKFSKGSESYIDDTIDPYGTSHPISHSNHNDHEKDGMKDNILYETSGNILPNENYSSAQVIQSKSSDVEYAQVKKNGIKTNDDTGENKIELSHMNRTENDLYAVVNKSKSNTNDDNSPQNSYTTSEGLVYLHVEAGGLKNSEPQPNNSDIKKEKEDKNDNNHVVYADVVVT